MPSAVGWVEHDLKPSKGISSLRCVLGQLVQFICIAGTHCSVHWQLVWTVALHGAAVMFIKKDTRKVREILRDSGDVRSHLKLARREAEFNGSTHVRCSLCLTGHGSTQALQVLCDEISEESISNVHYLSLYGNKLQKLPGIGCFAVSPLQTLNVGRNLLPSLPLEVGSNSGCSTACRDAPPLCFTDARLLPAGSALG